MTTTTFVRARRPEHKQQRREAILTAARDLAGTSGVGRVTLGAVAEAVGLAKSNISRYFGSREEIFLELLAQEWRQCTPTVLDRLRHVQDAPDAVAALTRTFVERPLLCDLLSHLPTSLELNVSVDAARLFKHSVHEAISSMGAALADATPLTASEGRELVGAAGGMAGLLYRASNPPPALTTVYAEDARLAGARRDLEPTLLRMLSALAAGLPTLRTEDPI